MWDCTGEGPEPLASPGAEPTEAAAGEGFSSAPALAKPVEGDGARAAAPVESVGDQPLLAAETVPSAQPGVQTASAVETGQPADQADLAATVEVAPSKIGGDMAAAAVKAGTSGGGDFAGRVAEAAAVLGEEPALVAALLQCPAEAESATPSPEAGAPAFNVFSFIASMHIKPMQVASGDHQQRHVPDAGVMCLYRTA